MTPYQRHVRKWKDCQRCGLAGCRRKIVLGKGRIPADILFTGESPGPSENLEGKPFVGPAGLLLDDVLEAACERIDLEPRVSKYLLGPFRYNMTNLVACYPWERNEDGGKREKRDPKKEEIQACSPRLYAWAWMVKPKLVVTLGDLAKKHVPKVLDGVYDGPYLNLHHPSYLVRMNGKDPRYGLELQRMVVNLSEGIYELL